MELTSKFLEEIFRKCNFKEVTEENCETQILSNLMIPPDIDWTYAYGASKFVIIFNDCDMVVKIPFLGMIIEEDGIYEDFTGASYSEYNNDYCESEVSIFEMACGEGLEEFFVETEFFIFCNDYPIYVQKKCIPFRYSKTPRHSAEERKTASKIRGKCFELALDWVCDAIQYYGEESVRDLIDFAYDNYIVDLHSGNIGYLNDAPVIFDYAGFES